MNKKEKDDYIILFKGAKLSKREANKVGLSIICGFVGIFLSAVIAGDNKVLTYIIILAFIAIGYFWLGNKIFEK